MKPRLASHLVLLTVLCAGLLVLTNSWARQNSAFDQLDLLIDIRHELMRNYVEKPDSEAMIMGAVRGMIGALNDPYTDYLTAEDLEMFEHQTGGSFSGIGAEVDIHQNRVRIVTPLENSPAWEAGVMAGDLILDIDGESTLDMPLTEAVRRLTGERGTDVTIRVRRETGEEERITITRDVIDIQTVRGFRRDADQAYDIMLDPQRRIGYLRLTQFTRRTPEEMYLALTTLTEADEPIEALVLDLRFNAGGLLEAAVAVTDMFLEAEQQIVAVEGRAVAREVVEATDRTLLPQIPMVVLVNEASASGAEILAGALQDNDRAMVVGARSFGKGSVQQVKQLKHGRGALRMTNAYYYLPSGRLIHRRDDSEVWGVDPDQGAYVPMNPEQIRQMLEARREHERLRQENDGVELAEVTPQWLEETLKDPQLAAALRAAQGNLDTGEWPEVGETDGQRFAVAQRRTDLTERREALMEQLNEIDRQIAEFDHQENDDERYERDEKEQSPPETDENDEDEYYEQDQDEARDEQPEEAVEESPSVP